MLATTQFSTEQLRTVAVVGHGATGKTTLVEQLLAKSRMIGAAGSVEKGSTVSDFDPLEKTVLHSLRASIVHCDHTAGESRLAESGVCRANVSPH